MLSRTGQFSGGGYGPLARRYGLVAAHLYGVEVATVARDGSVNLTTATRNGPHVDLWWAHTGGGGGNFGIVARYLLRSPGSHGSDPAAADQPILRNPAVPGLPCLDIVHGHRRVHIGVRPGADIDHDQRRDQIAGIEQFGGLRTATMRRRVDMGPVCSQ